MTFPYEPGKIPNEPGAIPNEHRMLGGEPSQLASSGDLPIARPPSTWAGWT
jgi:hypothetical protein